MARVERVRGARKLQVHRQVCLFHRRRGCGETGKHRVCCQDGDGSTLRGIEMARAERARGARKTTSAQAGLPIPQASRLW